MLSSRRVLVMPDGEPARQGPGRALMRATDTMRIIDLETLRAMPLSTDPYEHVVVPRFVPPDRLDGVIADFPAVPGPGNHPVASLKGQGRFAALLEDLGSRQLRAVIEGKFGVSLDGRSPRVTVRGECQPSDGAIHTDAADKVITLLLYLNPAWDGEGGRLRLLRNATDLEDYAREIPPVDGTLLIFRRSDRSWHGHKSFSGPRRVIQINWAGAANDAKRPLLARLFGRA